MTDVYWFEQIGTEVPAENDWLGPHEAIHLERIRFAKRRADWRLGRWTAKRALAACLSLPETHRTLSEIEICPAASGEPEVFLANRPLGVSISLSHSCGTAVCAVALSAVALGCDREKIEDRSDTFVTDYFTFEEQALVTESSAAVRSRLLTVLWSGKESALKSLHEGLRLDTRSMIVYPSHTSFTLSGWHRLQVRYLDEQVFHGWWQCSGDFIQTLVSSPPPDRPLQLQSRGHLASRPLARFETDHNYAAFSLRSVDGSEFKPIRKW